MAEIIFTVIISIPIYILLILSYLYPEEMMLFGTRWMYKEKPEFSEGAVIYTKFFAIFGLFITTCFLIGFIIQHIIIIPIIILGISAFIVTGMLIIRKRVLDDSN
ncbi:hypothetical protein [Evansella cellulosilytica]|uniref:DUF6199 domain-containing protein n=1 Tax=Evansella cellulosilytica (strain ATCC 21833 / DSM 2522 / FERM P-1141 / JCM 9156 / N-4) TaxID=649639 RepID=E6TWI8_EVAC2|nr:hypothetical protein [Evansella cellulosilytica]ADU32251.1 hypothetical protein Bcell_4020 [Evansella cellulosilytica DSM 2522]